MKPLHLKYRPQILADLIGQDFVRVTLTNAITNNQLTSAYLFTGVRGTGKTSTARILAKSLNCLNTSSPTVSPCNKCTPCQGINQVTALDVTEIDAASHNSIDDARALIEQSNFAPINSRYKIFILDEFHMLSNSAQNALLKLLEEPPTNTLFILCTTELHKVLPTISSRCQVFNFKAISNQTMVKYLSHIANCEQIDITTDALTYLARTVEGGLRDALQLLSQLQLLGKPIKIESVVELCGDISSPQLTELVTAMETGNAVSIIQLSRSLTDSGIAPKLICSNLLAIMRDLLLIKSSKTNCQSLLTSSLSISILRILASALDFEIISQQLEQLQKSEYQLKVSINSLIWLETCLLNLIAISTTNLTEQQRNKLAKLIAAEVSDLTARDGEVSSPYPIAVLTAKSINENSSDSNLHEIWSSILNKIKPNNRKFLAQAYLLSLTNSEATLAVDKNQLKLFQQKTQAIASILNKILKQNIEVVIVEKSQ
jgi:DNA polymerase-3 subunit gamma/tau